MTKSGFVAIIGRPNSGKSTLINTICGKEIAIVSKVPQTTRNTIKGIYTKDNVQIVFLDTPGIHESVQLFNKMLNKQAKIALSESDIIIYLVDLTRRFGKEESVVLDMLKKSKKPIIVAFNKSDVKTKEVIANSIEYNNIFQENKFKEVFYISALKHRKIQELIDSISTKLQEGPFYYPASEYTDQQISFMVSEIIRKNVMVNTFKEVPHSVKVKVEDIADVEGKNLTEIYASIYMERDSQKGLIIGAGGRKLKIIGTGSRHELEKLFNKKVYLKLEVKVDKNWRKTG